MPKDEKRNSTMELDDIPTIEEIIADATERSKKTESKDPRPPVPGEKSEPIEEKC